MRYQGSDALRIAIAPAQGSMIEPRPHGHRTTLDAIGRLGARVTQPWMQTLERDEHKDLPLPA
jgi:hypothetical protein